MHINGVEPSLIPIVATFMGPGPGYQNVASLQLIPGSDNEYRFNYWGYSTANFFAPMSRYSQASLDGKPGSAIVDEFRYVVKECHRRGIEVILDVVFNHTAEGNEQGPTLSFRCTSTARAAH